MKKVFQAIEALDEAIAELSPFEPFGDVGLAINEARAAQNQLAVALAEVVRIRGVGPKKLTQEERELLDLVPREKIKAVMLIRARTGLGLKEAKDLAEEYTGERK